MRLLPSLSSRLLSVTSLCNLKAWIPGMPPYYGFVTRTTQTTIAIIEFFSLLKMRTTHFHVIEQSLHIVRGIVSKTQGKTQRHSVITYDMEAVRTKLTNHLATLSATSASAPVHISLFTSYSPLLADEESTLPDIATDAQT